MAKTILVPTDFTPVSLNALAYACALRNEIVSEIIAVHLLDPKIAGDGMIDTALQNPAFQKVFKHMQQEIIEKTSDDLRNFVHQQESKCGITIRPLVAYGTIYDSFAGIADEAGSVLTVMGTHGIVGLQHLTGSRAYKTVAQAKRPFLIVQTKPFHAAMRWYIVMKDQAQLQACAAELLAMSDCLPGLMSVNIPGGSATLPASLQSLSSRITLVSEPLTAEHNILHVAAQHSANALGYCIDELEDDETSIYGLGQPQIMANDAEMPVLCLSAKG